jgi:hypothetical protein
MRDLFVFFSLHRWQLAGSDCIDANHLSILTCRSYYIQKEIGNYDWRRNRKRKEKKNELEEIDGRKYFDVFLHVNILCVCVCDRPTCKWDFSTTYRSAHLGKEIDLFRQILDSIRHAKQPVSGIKKKKGPGFSFGWEIVK